MSAAPARTALVLAAVLLGAAGVAAEPAPVTAKVTYLTTSTAYVDAGREEGLAVGDRVEIVRDGTVVAVLAVVEVSAHRAACALPAGAALAVGDVARFVPSSSGHAAQASGPAARERRDHRSLRDVGIRGRIGVRWLAVRDRLQDGTDFTQPALDLLVNGTEIAGSPWSLAVDARARRTLRTLSDGSSDDTNRTRVYRLQLAYGGAGHPWRITAGRQYSPNLANVSLFDGVSFDWARPRWGFGAFSGTQPDPVDYGFSSEIREHGAYVDWHASPEARRRWSLTTGAVGSYDNGEINREFVFLQARLVGPRLAAYGVQEVDVNRGWRETAEGSSLSATSTFLNLRLRATDHLDLFAGYDNRRNVRLYRDYITPETEFDDAFRRGVWAGAAVRLFERFRLSLDARTSTGGTSGSADAYTETFSAGPFWTARLTLRQRSTRYSNDVLEGWLHSLSAGVDLGGRSHAELTAGVRDDTGVLNGALDDRVVWLAFDVDVALGRHWYLLLSLDRSDGDLEKVDQAYASVTWRF